MDELANSKTDPPRKKQLGTQSHMRYSDVCAGRRIQPRQKSLEYIERYSLRRFWHGEPSTSEEFERECTNDCRLPPAFGLALRSGVGEALAIDIPGSPTDGRQFIEDSSEPRELISGGHFVFAATLLSEE
jgi:hypothetical protein